MSDKITATLYSVEHFRENNNYYIDDIDAFLYTCSSLEIDLNPFYITDLFHTIKFVLNPNISFEDFKKYNYLKYPINNHDYYFHIISYEFVNNLKTVTCALSLDVLNTFIEKGTTFNGSTRVFREHRDRWIYKYCTKIISGVNNFFILRNFPLLINDPNKLPKIDVHNALCLTEQDLTISTRNYWLEIIFDQFVPDPLSGEDFISDFGVFYIPLNNISCAFNNQQLKGFFNLTPEQRAYILTNQHCVSLKVLPYEPSPIFSNIQQGDSRTIPITSIYTIKQIGIKKNNEEQPVLLTVIYTSYGNKLEDFTRKNNSECVLNIDQILRYETGASWSLTRLLFSLFVSTVRTTRLQDLKTSICEDGFFDYGSHPIGEEINQYINCNDPAIFSSMFFTVEFNMLKQKIHIFPEQISFNNEKVFPNFIDDYYANSGAFFGSLILKFSILNYPFYHTGFTFSINSGDYFNIKKIQMPFTTMLQLPMALSKYDDYIQVGHSYLEKMNNAVDKYNDTKGHIQGAWKDLGQAIGGNVGASIGNAVGGWAEGVNNWYKGLTSSEPMYYRNPTQMFNHFSHGEKGNDSLLNTAAHTLITAARSPFRAGLYIASKAVDAFSCIMDEEKPLKEFAFDESPDIAKIVDDYKLTLTVKHIPNRKQLENEFYYFGYTVNELKKPTHNSRQFFDYLECDPVFSVSSFYPTKTQLNSLITLFKNGVYFIHHSPYGWIFPTTENYTTGNKRVENVEVKLLEVI